jgi:hypothetical protein
MSAAKFSGEFSGELLARQCSDLCARHSIVRVDVAKATDFAASIAVDDVLATATAARAEDETTAALLLAWNSINFSYFPEAGRGRWRWRHPATKEEYGADDEANGVVAALVAANSQVQIDGSSPKVAGPPALADAAFLRAITADMLRDWVLKAAPGAGELPMADERARALRELGDGLERLGLTPLGLVKSANGSAAQLVATLVREFPLYGDVERFPNEEELLGFHKRAQLCVSMLHSAGVAGGFEDMHVLTVFADYRLPQLFRAADIGLLQLEPRLAALVDGGTPLEAGSADEVLIRAATVWAGAVLGDALRKRDGAANVTQAQLDYFLWKLAVSRDAAGTLPPFHRTRCTAY